MKTKLLIMIIFAVSGFCLKAQTWQVVGYSNFSPGITNYTCAAVDASGTPYVAFEDAANGLKITVMKFDGTAWNIVGTAGFSSGQARDISIAVNASGTPYVSFLDAGPDKALVMKFDGTNWVMVGTTYPSSSSVAYTSLKIDASGAPYIAFQDALGSSMNKVTVKKFDGTNWNLVGAAAFSAGQADYISLQLDNTGTPYVAFEDYGNSNKATVMKFNGTSWVTVGTAGFTGSTAEYTSLGIDNSGTPYVAYKDYNSTSKVSVMKFDGTNWVLVGTAGFSVGSVNYVNLLVDGNGVVYVTYQDTFFSPNRPFVQFFNGTAWTALGSGLPTGAADFTSLAINGTTLYFSFQDGSTSFKANLMKYDLANGIADYSLNENSVVYPNPFTVSTMIQFKSTVKNAELSIYDALGQKVRTKNNITGDQIIIDRDGMIIGVYFYNVIQNGKLISQGKLMINN